MLIHKGNFLKLTLAGLLLAGLAGPLPAAPSRATPATAAIRAPEAVAAEFYDWYLQTLDADQDPLSDRYDRLNAYVARPLVDQLLQRLREQKAAGDYFLQSSRIQAAWLRGRVQAVTLRRQARAADVLVTLDRDGDAKHELVLTMVLDNGIWKVRQVNRAALDATESSPSRAVI
ncbi:DUF3828 domain-containing protein [Massilia putida]|uniref:DUF3828 domain-containing protein n=1 Tax=Massilia putida TaxID=1141883 RepID=UPI000B2C3AD4|nr:DUF3828 domain-containing protein [Massilia putida]